MALKFLKKYIKKNLPSLFRYLINIRDNNLFIKKLRQYFKFTLNKNIHGVKIIEKERGILFDFTSSNYTSLSLRPKFEKDFQKKDENSNNKDVAIIIQGTLYGLEFFVQQTIEIYIKNFPNTKIILTVWEDEISESFKKKILDKVDLIINKKPKNIDHSVDLQIINTSSGILHAKKEGIKYCLKTRTDCRIYKSSSINFLKNLISLFPLKKECTASSRIISCAIDTRKYRVYGLSDILIFGETPDMEKYFLNESFQNSLEKYNFGTHPLIIKDTAVINEIFLCARYLKNLNKKLDWTLDDWWKSLSDYFCIIDPGAIDFFWYKYHWQFEQRFITNYTSDLDFAVEFSDWLKLYSNPESKFSSKFQEKWQIENGQIVSKK